MKEPKTAQRSLKKGARRALPAVPGGKALARLHQFEHEREWEETSVKPPAAKTRGRAKRTRGKMTTPDGGYLSAFQELGHMATRALAQPVSMGWRPLGPFAIPHGQTYGSGTGSRPAVAGRIGAVAVDPANPNHVLVGSAGGGVWETRNGGRRWDPRTDHQPSLAIGAIAFDPSDPRIVYAGTGEGDFFARLGAGLLRSTDGGSTWTVHATSPFVGIGFYDIVVDAFNGQHLLAATTGGLFESTNGGVTWTQRRTARTWDLSMHPPAGAGLTDEVFAACTDGLFRSSNGGTTWSAVSLPGFTGAPTRMEVCHAPSDGNIVYVFAVGGGGSGYVARRQVFGDAFTSFPPPASLSTGQAWYDWFAAVAPNNADVIYLGAIEVHKGVRATDGMWTWTDLSNKTSGDSIHPDQHHITFSPTDPNVIYVGNDGGIYRSPDAGISWESLNKGLCITEFEYLAQHPEFEAFLLGGTQDNGTLRYEGEEVWYHVQDGDGGDCGINAAAPYTCYHSFIRMGLERSTTGGEWGSWTYLPQGGNSLFYPPMEVNGTLVVQAGVNIQASRDSGATWSTIALPGGTASALAAPNDTTIYAGTTDGRLYRTQFVSGAWQTPLELTRPRVGYISDLSVDPTNPSRIWATYSSAGGSHVFRSDTGGSTWNDVSAGLPNIPVNAIELDPSQTDRVFIAADVGVYRSETAGATWMPFNNLLPNALAKDLLFHARSRLLRVALQSRGVWEIAVDNATMPDVDLYLRDSTVDTGRRTPSPSGVDDPFNFGSRTHWWQCVDIKVDSPSYQQPTPADVDFEEFEDDHGVFAAGLIHENTQRERVARVYVQVHNRGLVTATNVAVKAFFADASVGLPDLPLNFWINFPNNVLSASSPWQPIASHQTLPSVEAGRGHIVCFEWPVPVSAADHTCLLAIITAENDPVTPGELVIASLVPNHKKCGLKNLAIVNPPSSVGPSVRVLKLNLWPARKMKRYGLTLDRKPGTTLRGVFFSTRLSKIAKKMNLKPVKVDDEESASLERLLQRDPELSKRLDRTTAFQFPTSGMLLPEFELPKSDVPEPIVILVGSRPAAGHWSLIQTGEDGTIVGGYTLATTTVGKM